MRFLNVLCAIYWAVLFVLYVSTDYTPEPFTLGAALFLAALLGVNNALESR